jgi:Flp pilus assembly protein TadG
MIRLSLPGLFGPRARGISGLGELRHAAGGSAVVELALLAPVLFMFVVGIAETGRVLWLQNALDYSVAEAARCASINPTACGSAADIATYAAARSGSGLDAAVFSLTTPSPSCGNQVSAAYPMALMIPYLTLSVTLTAEACYPA